MLGEIGTNIRQQLTEKFKIRSLDMYYIGIFQN